MSRALWIPDALADHGLHVIRQANWDLRGDPDGFNPHGVVCHHTASNATAGNAPSLGICINGRPDLPGPLCHVLLARDATAYVIASGRANHAGAGGWRGLSGNSSVLGIEVENNGVGEPWTDQLLDAFARCCAALLEGMGDDTADYCCLHREWAPTRKIDPAGPGFPQDGNAWRARVQAALDNTGDLTIMDADTRSYLDAHFLAQVIATKQSELRIQKIIKRKFANDRERDAGLDQSIDALAAEIDALQGQLTDRPGA